MENKITIETMLLHDGLIPTFSSLRLVLLHKSAEVKFQYTIRILGSLPIEVYWYYSEFRGFLSILMVNERKSDTSKLATSIRKLTSESR